MRIMTRYVLGEISKSFLTWLVAFTGAIIVVLGVQEALKQGLPPGAILRLLPYTLPEALRVTVPVTLLWATTSVYSRMAGYNEVVAIKALGISPTMLLWPTLAIALLASLITVWLNDKAVSWGRVGAQRVVIDAVEEIAYGMLRTEHSYNSRKFSIHVKRVDDRRLISPIVTIPARGDAPEMVFEAQEAWLQSDHRENVLKVILRKGQFEMGKVKFRFPDILEREIPLSDASRADELSQSASCLPLWRIPGEIVKQEQAIERRQEELAATAAYQMLSGDFDDLTGDPWQQRTAQAAGMRRQLARLRTEPYRRWSAGFSCFFFAWIGAPVAIWLRHRDALTSFFLCFAPILVVYYPLWAYGIDGAKNGTIPPVSVWAGNVVLLAAGLWLLRKVLRH